MDDSMERQGTWQAERYASFHDHGIFVGVWIMVVLVGTKTMSAMRSILEPLLWAFFVMMALSPLVDFIEWALLRATTAAPGWKLCSCGRRRREALRAQADSLERQLSGAVEDEDGDSTAEDAFAEACFDPAAAESAHDEECGLQRMLAVLVVLVLFAAGITGFFVMIYDSAVHMQRNWENYELGAHKLLDRLSQLKDKAPEFMVEKMTNRALATIEEILSFLAGSIVEHITSTLVELVMMFLYLVFWLCQPVQFGEKVSGVFKRYILLKTIASVLYAGCIYVLLQSMQVDLAVVFALVTFVCNFVPEFGPFFAMLLPLPVILFDGRLERPVINVVVALVGQLALKFFFGNIVEVKLVERQQIMRMHPVTILFFVAFFGWIWGATGMLLSVPIVAVAKALVQVLPKTYRDPFLIFLEGDTDAPARYSRMVQEAQALSSDAEDE